MSLSREKGYDKLRTGIGKNVEIRQMVCKYKQGSRQNSETQGRNGTEVIFFQPTDHEERVQQHQEKQ